MDRGPNSDTRSSSSSVNCQREFGNPQALVFRVRFWTLCTVLIGRSNTGTHLRTHWRSAAFHLKYAGDYFPLLLCTLSASDIVLLLGLHRIYILSLPTNTLSKRQKEIYSYQETTHVTGEDITPGDFKSLRQTSQRWASHCRDRYRPDGAAMRTSATIR